MLTGNTPDITPAQIVAAITAVLTQLVNYGLLSGASSRRCLCSRTR
jgi:hypothetical protein